MAGGDAREPVIAYTECMPHGANSVPTTALITKAFEMTHDSRMQYLFQ